MATKAEKIEKLETELKTLKDTLTKYGDMFNADGHIDTEEQKQLDRMQTIIQKAEAKLTKMKSSDEKSSDDNTKSKKPFTVAGSGDRKILTPNKPNGATMYFFYGYTGTKKDQSMRDSETANLADDVIDAAAKGFKVIYDEAGTKQEFEDALYDSSCAGIYWSGHGYPNGDIQSSDGKVISAGDFDPKKVSGKLKFLIFAACNSAQNSKGWKNLIGGKAAFEGWKDVTTTSETNDFTEDSALDSWVSHEGTNPDKELDDYIDDADKKIDEDNTKK